MTQPVRLQLSRARGFNLQAASMGGNGLPAINCARPGKWGNPYRIFTPDNPRRPGELAVRSREAAVVAYEGWLRRRGDVNPVLLIPLRGKNLACWCPLPKAGEIDMCHAAVLLREANK